jgi:uncharacterized protein
MSVVRSLLLLLLLPAAAFAQAPTTRDGRYTRVEQMVPMRDGVKLYTVVYVPTKPTTPLPILLTRTPYGIGGSEGNLRNGPQSKGSYAELTDDGYAFAFQDIRGRMNSEGTFVMCRAGRDQNDPKSVDEASDTSDTIDWLLKTVPENNGRVGILGVSYPGWLAACAALDPHPALKAASPQASPADMFLGDDFHHHGAFRLSYGFEYTTLLEADPKRNVNFQFDIKDTFEWYLKLGALSNVDPKYYKGKMPTWNDFTAHPNYDEFWQKQALIPRIDKAAVPTLNVAGWYDQEDFRGQLKLYEAFEKHDKSSHNFIVVGPWNHGGWSGGPGSRLGRISWDSNTGPYYREKVQAPFFAKYLKDKGDKAPPEAVMFQTGLNQWKEYDAWPPKGSVRKTLYFHPDGKLGFELAAADGKDEYVSDPANPVPYRPRPINPTYQGPGWTTWMLEDQRFLHRRKDVLAFESEPLAEDLVVAGSMTVKIFGSTTGTDCDWIAKVIDVYPDEHPKDQSLGGYQLMIMGEPVRARFRKSYEKPEPVTPGAVEEYSVDLHWGHHRFKKGHRVMVQIQSTWFPVIDRNPQKYVPNIYLAKDEDFQKATMAVHRGPKYPSGVVLESLPEGK